MIKAGHGTHCAGTIFGRNVAGNRIGVATGITEALVGKVLGTRAELQGAEIQRDKSFVHIDRRNSGRYKHNNNVAKINLNRIVFRAKSPTQVIAFNDEKAALGEELIVNFIQLRPYLE